MTRNRQMHLAWGTGSLAFGLILIWTGYSHGAFTGEAWRVPAVIFGVIWLVVTGILGLYFKQHPPRADGQPRSK